MGLANAIQDARHTPQRITWTDTDGDPVDLTGATLTGRIRNVNTGETADIDGDLDVVTAASGIFDWTYGADDVAEAGDYLVQFSATFADTTKDKTLHETWTVVAAL